MDDLKGTTILGEPMATDGPSALEGIVEDVIIQGLLEQEPYMSIDVIHAAAQSATKIIRDTIKEQYGYLPLHS